MRLHREFVAPIVVLAGLVGVSGSASAQRAEPVGAPSLAVRALAAPSPSDDRLMLSRTALRNPAREERTIAGALIGAGVGAVAAYLHTHYGSPEARRDTGDAHELDFFAYVVAMPVGALIGAMVGYSTGEPPGR